jgi:hypothetical protein
MNVPITEEENKIMHHAAIRYSIDNQKSALRALKSKNKGKATAAREVLPIYNKIMERKGENERIRNHVESGKHNHRRKERSNQNGNE